jgi:hypothetical protein
MDLELDRGEIDPRAYGLQPRGQQTPQRSRFRLRSGARACLPGRCLHHRLPRISPSSSATPPATATACQGLSRT